MPKVKVNPDAKQPEFVAIIGGQYQMKFERLTGDAKVCGESEKGYGPWVRLRLTHVTPATQLTGLVSGQPLGAMELPGSVSAIFMYAADRQGRLRQAIEATGQAWPTDPAFEIDEEWIQSILENREVTVILGTKFNQDRNEWQNEVSRYITA